MLFNDARERCEDHDDTTTMRQESRERKNMLQYSSRSNHFHDESESTRWNHCHDERESLSVSTGRHATTRRPHDGSTSLHFSAHHLYFSAQTNIPHRPFFLMLYYDKRRRREGHTVLTLSARRWFDVVLLSRVVLVFLYVRHTAPVSS